MAGQTRSDGAEPWRDGDVCLGNAHLGPQAVTHPTARDRRWARGSQGSASPWDRLWASYPPPDRAAFRRCSLLLDREHRVAERARSSLAARGGPHAQDSLERRRSGLDEGGTISHGLGRPVLAAHASLQEGDPCRAAGARRRSTHRDYDASSVCGRPSRVPIGDSCCHASILDLLRSGAPGQSGTVACEAPCDPLAPVDCDYVIVGEGIRTSRVFTLTKH